LQQWDLQPTLNDLFGCEFEKCMEGALAQYGELHVTKLIYSSSQQCHGSQEAGREMKFIYA